MQQQSVSNPWRGVAVSGLPVFLLPPSYCSPAHLPRGDAEAKMCFILPNRCSGSPGSAYSIDRGLLDTSTTDTKTLRASAGLASQGTLVTQKERRDGHDFALDISRFGGLV